jgi:hypothetical protein
MRKLNVALLSTALLCGLAAAGTADANGRHHRGGRAHFGVFIGGPVFPYYAPYYSPYYYPRYYYPPTVVVPAPSAPVYIEQGTAPAASPTAQNSTAYWYYCADSQTYYPYVQQCASPWQQVVPQNPPPG